MLYVPYVDARSERLLKPLKDLEVELVFSRGRTLRSELCKGMKFREPKTSTMDEDGVVYAIPCSSCDCHYIGETGRRLSTRLKEHEADCRTAEETSGPFDHMRRFDHRIDFKGTIILAREKHWKRRKMIESCLIRTMSPLQLLMKGSEVMNQDKGKKLHPSWDRALAFEREAIAQRLETPMDSLLKLPFPKPKEEARSFLSSLQA